MKKLIDFFRFKKLDWYVLKQYIGPFFITFLLAWFVLIMQFFWVYIDDLIGKGIETSVLFKFITYTSATLIPMSLPLAVLLSSIMTFGKFGENVELTSAKSSGISLFRFFKSTIFFSILVSIFAFYFSNYIYTKTQVVARTMLGDIRNLKPSLLIKPKQFYNGISGASIRIENKDDKTGMMYDVKIYNHSLGSGNNSILLAKSAKFSQSDDGKVLILRLDSGVHYKDEAMSASDNIKYPFYITRFTNYEKRFDLSQFKLDDKMSKNPDEARMTMDFTELNIAIDSLKKELKIKSTTFDTNFSKHNSIFFQKNLFSKKINLKDSLKILNPTDKVKYKIVLTNKMRNIKNYVFTHKSDVDYTINMRNLYMVEWHRKFTLAISCLVLFFVGAPLGAIIKKGGIGLPMFISIILFIIFYMLTKSMASLAENNKIAPFLGMWTSTFIFLPFGIFLTYKAMNDSQMMNIEGFQNWIIEKFSKLTNGKSK